MIQIYLVGENSTTVKNKIRTFIPESALGIVTQQETTEFNFAMDPVFRRTDVVVLCPKNQQELDDLLKMAKDTGFFITKSRHPLVIVKPADVSVPADFPVANVFGTNDLDERFGKRIGELRTVYRAAQKAQTQPAPEVQTTARRESSLKSWARGVANRVKRFFSGGEKSETSTRSISSVIGGWRGKKRGSKRTTPPEQQPTQMEQPVPPPQEAPVSVTPKEFNRIVVVGEYRNDTYKMLGGKGKLYNEGSPTAILEDTPQRMLELHRCDEMDDEAKLSKAYSEADIIVISPRSHEEIGDYIAGIEFIHNSGVDLSKVKVVIIKPTSQEYQLDDLPEFLKGKVEICDVRHQPSLDKLKRMIPSREPSTVPTPTMSS